MYRRAGALTGKMPCRIDSHTWSTRRTHLASALHHGDLDASFRDFGLSVAAEPNFPTRNSEDARLERCVHQAMEWLQARGKLRDLFRITPDPRKSFSYYPPLREYHTNLT